MSLAGSSSRTAGFTLVEALLSVVILGLMVTGISALYLSGLQSLNTQDDRMLLDMGLTRSDVSWALSLPYGSDPSDELNNLVERRRDAHSWARGR